jgi:ribosomal-protein-alanine N-acetyltransferase
MAIKPAVSSNCRPLTVSVAKRCAALHKASFAAPWSILEFERLLASSSVIADGNGVQGDISGFILSRRAADEAEILTIAVDPAVRKSGIATALLAYHLSRLSRAGVAQLFLEVDEANKPALGYYARPDGSRATALVLRCAL